MRRSIGVIPEAPPEAGFRAGMSGFAAQLWWERRWRTRFFPAELFGEPAWDILLAAYASPAGLPDEPLREPQRPHLSACAPPQRTARHRRELEALGLLEPSPSARKESPLVLTPEARERMGKLLSDVLLQRTRAVGAPGRGGNGGSTDGESHGSGSRLTLLLATMVSCLDEVDQLGLGQVGVHLSMAIETLERQAAGRSREAGDVREETG